MIQHALRASGGHMEETASRLGVSRKGLYLKRVRLNQALVRPNHALRLTGFDTFAAVTAQGRSLMDIGR